MLSLYDQTSDLWDATDSQNIGPAADSFKAGWVGAPPYKKNIKRVAVLRRCCGPFLINGGGGTLTDHKGIVYPSKICHPFEMGIPI